MFDSLKNHRELAEWFKATSLSLVKGKTFICSNHILSGIINKLENVIYRLEPGWLGVSFGLRSSYVRIIIT